MQRTLGMTAVLAAGAGLAACGGGAGAINKLPGFVAGTPVTITYDASGDDLLTAGLGKTGLGAAAPAFANPAAPTAAELRRNAIHTNYRALVDTTAGGGFGTLYGPNVSSAGQVTSSEGRIAGRETIAYADDGSGRQNVVLMVQVPDSFDVARPCIVTATSSGSRGIYGAIGTAGEWGLKRGCAVAYTDKGTGNGMHDLMTNRVAQIDGLLADAATAGKSAHFAADITEAQRSAFNAQFPDRVAYKHAHSQQNSEKDWGRNTLRAVEFAFWQLNERFGNQRTINQANTIVIASSVSNGGGAALAAAEQDTRGLIDAVVVSEPHVQTDALTGLTVRQGSTDQAVTGKPLFDYFTFANLYQPCAALAVTGAPAAAFLSAVTSANRCTALAAKGLVSGATTAEQAADALARLRAYGYLANSDVLHPSMYRFATNSIAVTYANAYGRFSVLDNVCGYSFANTSGTGDVVAQVPASFAGLFATGNGVPPSTGINIVYNLAAGGPRQDLLALSPSSGLADFALDGALCLRALATGADAVTGAALTGDLAAQSQRVRQGIVEAQLKANVRSKPTIILAGRDDTLIPVNHAARPYVGRNWVNGNTGNVRYVEVLNGQHFETFIGNAVFAGYDTRYVPLHHYFNQALDRMWETLTAGAALPGSQVVRTVPRGGTAGAAPAITAANVPPIAANPAAGDAIQFSGGVMTIPD